MCVCVYVCWGLSAGVCYAVELEEFLVRIVVHHPENLPFNFPIRWPQETSIHSLSLFLFVSVVVSLSVSVSACACLFRGPAYMCLPACLLACLCVSLPALVSLYVYQSLKVCGRFFNEFDFNLCPSTYLYNTSVYMWYFCIYIYKYMHVKVRANKRHEEIMTPVYYIYMYIHIMLTDMRCIYNAYICIYDGPSLFQPSC